jgi:hypothetical protein
MAKMGQAGGVSSSVFSLLLGMDSPRIIFRATEWGNYPSSFALVVHALLELEGIVSRAAI